MSLCPGKNQPILGPSSIRAQACHLLPDPSCRVCNRVWPDLPYGIRTAYGTKAWCSDWRYPPWIITEASFPRTVSLIGHFLPQLSGTFSTARLAAVSALSICDLPGIPPCLVSSHRQTVLLATATPRDPNPGLGGKALLSSLSARSDAAKVDSCICRRT